MQQNQEKALKLKPVVKGSGFRIDGYYVWCGSVLKENGKYYLFAARWPKEKTFPLGYLSDSEIVLATTDDLAKPFKFEKVIIGKRDGGYWDGVMAHNPYITKIGDEYVLFYIGSPDGGTVTRKIGWARTRDLLGEWERSEKPIDLPPDANNPSAVVTENGVYLYFRNGKSPMEVLVAKADRYDGEYTVLNDNLFPGTSIEDMFVYRTEEGFKMVTEDGGGCFTGLLYGGVSFASKDGITWDRENFRQAYDFTVEYDDGTTAELQRRERPFLLFDEGKIYLFNAAKIGGETQRTGGDTWNMVEEVEELRYPLVGWKKK